MAKAETCSVALIEEQRGHVAEVSASSMRRSISNSEPQSGQRYSYIGILRVYFSSLQIEKVPHLFLLRTQVVLRMLLRFDHARDALHNFDAGVFHRRDLVGIIR